ncbi:MAG: serine hydrolase [Puia sp.]|nr:serine hydrolase [Puia sp.]
MSYKVIRTCLPFSLTYIFLLIWRPAFSQDFGQLDQLFKQNQKALGNFAAVVYKDGKVLYQKQASADFTVKSPAPIANAGNWMTAALVMTFVDEGKLSLDDKVSKYIPLFATYSKAYITLRNCLTNTTGIQAETKVLQKSKYESLEEEVNSYASKRDIVTNPSTEFYYSSVGPNIAARVLEVITKKSFDRLMKERILSPLKMRGTSFSNDDGGAINPSGGARSTANDYINFLAMLLNKGTLGDKKVLSPKAVEELETIQYGSLPIKFSPKGVQGLRYTLGAWILDTDGAGNSQSLSCPNFAGTTPFLDRCRGYAAILILEKPDEDSKKDLFAAMRNIIDQQISCK